MGIDEEEYVAESRDPTPEPMGDLPPEQVSPSHPVSSAGPSRAVNPDSTARVPDMQLGRCKYVRLHDNINYVAAAIIFRGDGANKEILLIQEAKKSCRGKWYLPAGRVEAGETLIESVQREVKEEAGFECEVKELLSLQVQGSGWYRFVFIANISGGELKTFEDKESLQAQWFPVDDVKTKGKITLRQRDFVKLVDEANAYSISKHFENVPLILPINDPIQGMFIEFLIYKYSMDDSQVDVLVHKSVKEETSLISHDQPFPTVEFGFEFFFAMAVSKCYWHLLVEGTNVVFCPSHVVRVKCAPTPMESIAHGLQVRLACEHKKSCGKGIIKSPSRYHWLRVEDPEIKRQLYLQKGQYKPSLHML